MSITAPGSSATTISNPQEPLACDVIVIGSGPAGMCAALYLARANLRTILIGDHTKSLLAKAAIVGNHLGMPEMSGIAMLGEFLSHCKRAGVHCNTLEATDVRGEDGNFTVKLSDGTTRSAKKLVIASGTAYKHAGIKGEDVLTGKGIAYCVACDGPFFAGKTVTVIGNGNYAAEEALEMLGHTTTVAIVTQGLPVAIGSEYLKLIKDRGIKVRT